MKTATRDPVATNVSTIHNAFGRRSSNFRTIPGSHRLLALPYLHVLFRSADHPGRRGVGTSGRPSHVFPVAYVRGPAATNRDG